MNTLKSVITLTFGESAENHVGMEKLGSIAEEGKGFSTQDLRIIQNLLGGQVYSLNPDTSYPEASVYVLPNGINTILSEIGKTKDDLFAEQIQLEHDKKALMYGRVVNKNARWNLCFDDVGHEPEYEKGKGRVIPWDQIPLTKHIRENLHTFFGPKAAAMKCEANYYYDKAKCGIGFHGDSERRKVVGMRLGSSMDICYQWYKDNQPVGDKIIIPLNGGDIYIMSEKAVGTDWKKRSILTLRHAAGSPKFTGV